MQLNGSKAQFINYANADVHDYRILSITKGIILDNNLCSFLEMELHNTKFCKVRKLSNKKSLIISSKYILNKNRKN